MSVPLGRGMDRRQEEFRLAPPLMREVRNQLFRAPGGYLKAPGWTSSGSGAGQGSPQVLVNHNDRSLIALGQKDTSTLGGSGAFSNVNKGPQYPTGIEAFTALALRGVISHVNIAHIQGYTAIVGLTSDDDFVGTGGGTTAETAFDAFGAIFDASGDLIAGPYRWTNINQLPRVEPLLVSSVPHFVFVGVEGVLFATSSWNLRAVRISTASPPTGTAPTTTVIGTAHRITSSTGNTTLFHTHVGDEQNVAYIVYYDGSNIVCSQLDGNTVYGKTSVPSSLRDRLAVYHHASSQTILVSVGDGTSTTIYYAGESLSSFVSAGSTTGTEWPMFYDSTTGGAWFSGATIGFSGGPNPATPTVSGSAGHTPPGTIRNAQTFGGLSPVLFFGHESGGSFTADQSGLSSNAFVEQLPDHSWIDALALDSAQPYTVAPLNATRYGPVVYAGSRTPPSASYTFDSGPLQTAKTSDGKVLVPWHVRAAASKPWTYADPYSVRGTDRVFFEGGKPNQDHVLGWTVLSPLQPDLKHSEISYQGSTLVAAGNVCMWDGEGFFDLLAPPKITQYTNPGTLNTNTAHVAGYVIPNGSSTTHVLWWAGCIVLVYIDKNGIEYRSAPSNFFTCDDLGEDIEIELDPSHERILNAGGSFDVEFYVTTRSANALSDYSNAGAASEGAIDFTTYELAQRSPLQESGGTYYVPDMYLRTLTHGNIPLYTASGELAPVRPPAAHAVAQAGNHLFLVPSEFPFELWPTKPLERGRGPEWAPEIAIPVPSQSGGCESLAAVGDRLLLLCKRGVWELFAASGPDASGIGGFGAPRLVHLGDGCVSHSGTVSTSEGVFYLAASGPKLINTAQVLDISEPVRSYFTGNTVLTAEYHPAEREVWYGLDSGETLVFSLSGGDWAVLDLDTSSYRFFDGLMYRIDESGGDVQFENALSGQVNGSAFNAKTVSPWLTFETPMGYQRCRRIGVLVRKVSGTVGQLRITLAYDYVDSEVDTFTFDLTEARERNEQFVVRPSRQKFDSVRVTVVEYPAVVELEQVDSDHIWSLAAIDLEVASKRGLIKLQSAAKG
ncbi:MAG: hypothetical protein RLP09_09585 [Sandaracinaceae bacterium]